MLPIQRTARADEDLIAIWMHIAEGNPGAADRVLDAIAQRWEQLARHPQSGLARDDIAPGLRHLIIGQYMTLYRISGDGIEIIRVIHGRRRIDRDVAGWRSAEDQGAITEGLTDPLRQPRGEPLFRAPRFFTKIGGPVRVQRIVNLHDAAG